MHLRSKILLLAVGPLLFQIALLVFLTGLLKQAETDLRLQLKVAEIQSLSNNLHSDVSSCFLYALMSHAGDPAIIRRRLKTLTAEIRELKKKLCYDLEDNGYDRDAIERLKNSVDHVLDLGNLIEVDDPTSRGRDERMGFTIETTQVILSLNDQVNKINLYTRRLFPDSRSATRSSENVVLFLYAAFLADLLIAFTLGVVTIKNIVNRVKIVNQNAINLAEDKPLQPAVGGNDEIAELDRVFRKMAVSLFDSNQKQKALVENTIDVLCAIDSSGKFVNVSGSAKKNWGLEPAALIGRQVITIIADDDKDSILDSWQKAKETKAQTSIDANVLTASGEFSESRWSMIWSDQDKNLFCLVRDVGRENELVRMKQALMDTAAHDLRAPLTAITTTLNNLSLGVFGPVSEAARERINRSEELARRLIRLVSDLLDHEKLSSGKMSYTKAAVDLKPLLTEAILALTPLAEKKDVVIDLKSDNINLNLDRDRILQVLQNLLSNAIRYSPARSKIYVRTLKTRDYVEIQVIDSGPGVADEHKNFIFLRYAQLPAANEKSGSGLGLAISKAIVEDHGGTMGVSDNERGGSIFWVRIAT